MTSSNDPESTSANNQRPFDCGLVIYGCRAVRGPQGSLATARFVRDTIVNAGHRFFPEHIFTLEQPDIWEYERHWEERELQEGRSASVYARDIERVNAADGLVALVDSPSFGAGFEVGYAVGECKKSALLLIPVASPFKMATENTHPLITRGMYVTNDDIYRHIHRFLAGIPRLVSDPGILISYEGIDGCGKGTQIDLAQAYLESLQRDVVVSREPGGTSLGEINRDLLLHPEILYAFRQLQNEERSPRAEVFLYVTSRAEFVAKKVDPALAEGRIVIADRFHDSSVAYQGGGRFHNDSVMIARIQQLNDFAIHGREPDITFLLRIDYETMMARSSTKNLDYMERNGREFFERVIVGYDLIAERNPQRVVIIDGKKTPDAIFEVDIRTRLDDLLLKK
jgi:dTMP kinase